MSEGPQAAPPSLRYREGGPSQRSAKNYLINRRFQLKYTGLLVGIALTLSAALGIILWRTSSQVIQQSHQAVQQGQMTVRQGQETVKRGRQVVESSRNLSRVVAITIAASDNADLEKTFAEDSASDEKKLKEEQSRLEADAEALKKWAIDLEQQAKQVEAQQRSIATGLVIVLSLLVLCVGFAGIVFTHKVAGPIYKMKRLLREVGDGKLVVREKLRRGDELHDFFETFERMVGDLRRRQASEADAIDEALAKLEPRASSDGAIIEGVERLKRLRAEMREHLDEKG